MNTTAADTTDPGATEAGEAKNIADFLDSVREVLTMPRPSPAERQKVRDQDRLLHDTYPGEYVAYRDTWDGLTFVRREVLAHSPDLRAVHEPLAARYSDRELDTIRVTHCEPVERRGKLVLPYRPKLPTAPE